jgi:hypothetical protein
MPNPNFDDPVVEEQWCLERQSDVSEHLKRDGVVHGCIGEWPAWHVAPYVSLWAIESIKRPGEIGWWAICGDLPTDYISADSIHHPRDAMRAIASRWLDLIPHMIVGASSAVQLASAESRKDFAPLLERHAKQLLSWAEDDSHWGPEYDDQLRGANKRR